MADKAVICGVNDYANISDLRGCINDVENLSVLLREAYGFAENNLRLLKDSDVTREQIEDAFDWLQDGAADGDRLVFHFSGHGSTIQSENDDEVIDELLCLYGMDWDDPKTFLVDENLGELCRGISRGRLTIILDSCHSGTGTRAITQAFNLTKNATAKSQLLIVEDTARQVSSSGTDEAVRRLKQGNRALMQSLRDEREHPVFARFVPPPADLRPERSPRRVRKLGVAARETLNHQLLAAARPDQTAADAFIDGSYNGAFTYYLCESARNAPRGTNDAVLAATRQAVSDNGYSQVPQCEGPFGADRFLGGAVSPGQPRPVDITPPAPAAHSHEPPRLPRESAMIGVLADLLRVAEKLIDYPAATPPSSSGAVQRTSGEYIVYVHGISRHTPGYSASWFQALRGHLRSVPTTQEVLWSHHVNPRSLGPADEVEAQAFAEAVEHELERRAQEVRAPLPTAEPVPAIGVRGDGFAIDDFARYMTNRRTREAILAEFDRVVNPLLAAGKTVHVVSHSWGTVVAYEGLRRLDDRSMAGRVENLFVLGSALSMSVVRSNLFRRVQDGRRPAQVTRIINLDAGGDIVGGPIGEQMAVTREYLGLEPTGCRTIPFTSIAMNPSCAHSSYFKADNLEVNREILARFINALA